jgi:hypothetical protein
MHLDGNAHLTISQGERKPANPRIDGRFRVKVSETVSWVRPFEKDALGRLLLRLIPRLRATASSALCSL